MNTKNEKAFFRFVLAVLALIALILAWGGAAQCQSVDIQIPRPTSDYVAVRNLVLGQSGSGGFNNVFVFQSLYSQESICLSIFNGSSSNESIQVNISATNDPGITAFTGNTSRWNQQIAMEGTTNNAGNVTINAGSWAQFYAQSSGAARIAIVLTGSNAATGTADIVISQSQTQTATVTPGTIISADAPVVGNFVSQTGIGFTLCVQVTGTQTGISYSINGNSGTVTATSQLGSASITTPAFFYTPFADTGYASTTGNFSQSGSIAFVSGSSAVCLAQSGGGTQTTITLRGSPGTGITGIATLVGQSGTSTGDALRSTSASNLAPGAFNIGALLSEKGPRWSTVATPASGSQAVATKAAGVGTRHVVDCISFSAFSTAAVAASTTNVQVFDGATVLWTYGLGIPSAAGIGTQEVAPFSICGLNLAGTVNTGMSVQFGAGIAGLGEQVSISGFDVQ